jgi:hypothetical protein
MKLVVRLIVSACLVLGGAFATAGAASAHLAGNTQGCTPGYWKQQQHFDSWQEGAKPTDLFTRRFEISAPVPSVLDGLTFEGALQGGGGKGLDGARLILARAATAAWLNAAYDAPDGSAMYFPWRRYGKGYDGEPPLVSTVRDAITGSSREAMLDLASRLDAANNLGCPLS